MSRSGDKGREGEAGIVRHLSLWYKRPDLFAPRRTRSKGSQDDGDLSGLPLTTIECKNYTKPQFGAFIKNAQWKASNSSNPLWFLTVKRNGKAIHNSGHWYAACTLHDFLERLELKVDEESLQELLSGQCTLLLEPKDMSEYGDQFRAPKVRWPVLVFPDGRSRNHFGAVEDMRSWLASEEGDELREALEQENFVPMTLVRIQGTERDDLNGWCVLTTVHWMGRLLESVGILDQDEREYQPGLQHWSNFDQDRWPASEKVL